LAGGLAPTPFNTQYTSQVYVRDRQAAATEWISVCTLVSGESSDSFKASISGDGRFVAYESDSTTAVANDTNGQRDVFVRDRQTATAERVNVSSSGAQAITVGPSVSTGSGHASISRTGRYVAFKSYATNLDPSDALSFNVQDVFLRDRQTGTTTLESARSSGVQGNFGSEDPAISGDGRTIAFASFANDLVPGDTNLAPDIFVRNLAPQSYCTAGTSTNGCVPAISGAGQASASAVTGFTLSLTGVEGQKSGLFFYGIAGPITSPWGAGGTSVLCVKAPTQRLTTQSSGGTAGACDGVLSEDWNAYVAAHPSTLGAPFAGGETVWAQGWYRDPPSAKTTALSNGLVFTVAP
jgi:Tol biopolymer transport system component